MGWEFTRDNTTFLAERLCTDNDIYVSTIGVGINGGGMKKQGQVEMMIIFFILDSTYIP